MPYCRNCGKKIAKDAFVCPACGVRPKAGKSKTTAVLLAVFFMYWTWLYTYRADKRKFWVSLAICVVFATIGLFADFADDAILSFISYVPAITIWIAAMVNTISKPSDWYLKYE